MLTLHANREVSEMRMLNGMAVNPDLTPVLRHWSTLEGAAAESLPCAPLPGGLINATFAVGSSHVLQRLHAIFRAEVNDDIAALVPHLHAAGVAVPEIVRTRVGGASVTLPAGQLAGVWRILTRLSGATLHKVPTPSVANSAARLVARFHGALRGVEHTFAFTRPGAHETDLHLAKLEAAVERRGDHRLYAQVSVIANEVRERWLAWGPPPALPRRIIHGDLKVSNLLFDGLGRATGIIDLDTIAHGGLDVEMGDALRSWCNRGLEDDPYPEFDTAIAVAALEGYADSAAPWLTAAELVALPAAALRITLELTMRFAADALEECYFGWDSERFATRGDHCLARAQNQLGLARAAAAALPELTRRARGLAQDLR
jgi:Ser/Thr protein kinase RdoA (MazF antagonist)